MDIIGNPASIFHIMHQCFIHMQQARAFEEEFRFYQLQLKVHLSRCITVSRIIYDTNDADNISAIHTIDGPTIAENLSAIQDQLRKAQQEAAEMADFLKLGPPQLEAVDNPQPMRARMTGFFSKRKVQAAKTVEGIKWSFYEKAKRDKFIADISALIKFLEREVKVNVNTDRLSLGNSRIISIARAHSSIM